MKTEMGMTDLIDVIINANNNKKLWMLGQDKQQILENIKGINVINHNTIEIIDYNNNKITFNTFEGWII